MTCQVTEKEMVKSGFEPGWVQIPVSACNHYVQMMPWPHILLVTDFFFYYFITFPYIVLQRKALRCWTNIYYGPRMYKGGFSW